MKFYNQGDNGFLCIEPVTMATKNNLEGQIQHAVTPYRENLDTMAKLVQLAKDRKPIFVQFTEGARKGSIARISGCLQTTLPRKISGAEKVGLCGDVLVQVATNWNAHQQMHLFFPELLVLSANIKVEFDGKKPITTNWTERETMEWLPDYQGPTVFQYAKTVQTDEEKAAAKAAKQASHYPLLDKMGHEIKVGDMFFYGSANDLAIGKLIKVGESGVVTYKPWDSVKITRIMSPNVLENVKKGEPCRNLLLFTNDLGSRMMIYKLSK